MSALYLFPDDAMQENVFLPYVCLSVTLHMSASTER